MQRASVLLALLERVVRSMLRDESRKSLSDGEIRAILAEMLRVELARLIELENAEECPDGAEVEARIAELEAENDRLRDAARRRDWSEVAPKLDAAGQVCTQN
jgi:predicted house-cleaning noncanonical NTP pyrophosphatase (MazG superfamily)